MQFSRKIETCTLSPIRKFLPYEIQARAAGHTIYHLNIGQPDIPTPRAFLETIRANRSPFVAYAPAPGLDNFVDAVRESYEAVNIALDRRDILVTSGASEALQILFACILNDGDEVLVPEPYYPNFRTFITLAGGVIRPIPTFAEDGYRYADYTRLKPLIHSRTRAILITNPSNPTGTVLTPEEQHLLLEIAREHQLFLISDEIYRELVYNGTPAHSMLESWDSNIVVVDSVSKRFSATGARVGMLISRNRELMEHALKLCQGRLGLSTLNQEGAAALYRSVTPEYFSALREEYRRRRDAVVEELPEIPGVQFTIPEGALYLMASLPVDDAERLQYFLLDEFDDDGDTVLYAPGEGFYTSPGRGRNEIRLAFSMNETALRRSIQILRRGIRAYREHRRNIP